MPFDRVLLLGGNPKGFDIPFHQRTVSGRRLRGMLNALKFNPEIMDLWKNQAQEDNGHINKQMLRRIERRRVQGYIIAGLGKRVHASLENAGVVGFYKLKHPASRDPKHLSQLSAYLHLLKFYASTGGLG